MARKNKKVSAWYKRCRVFVLSKLRKILLYCLCFHLTQIENRISVLSGILKCKKYVLDWNRKLLFRISCKTSSEIFFVFFFHFRVIISIIFP